jgi:plastocyanin
MLLFFPGCGLSGRGEPDPRVEEARALGFPDGARLHRVTLGGRGAREHAVPALIQAHPGDGVEFITADHRVHTVTFPADSLAPEARAFLESTGQLGSPPLVSRGTRFVLRLQDAPPGRYPFVSDGHGGTAHGVILVEPPSFLLRPGRN